MDQRIAEMADRIDRITVASEAIRAVLESRPVLMQDGITQGRIHPGWVGPIAWELAEAAVDSTPKPGSTYGGGTLWGVYWSEAGTTAGVREYHDEDQARSNVQILTAAIRRDGAHR